VAAGPAPRVAFRVRATRATTLRLEVRQAANPDNHLPETVLAARAVPLAAGVETDVAVEDPVTVDADRYLTWCLLENPDVEVRTSEFRATGVLSTRHHNTQRPEHDIGVETFEIWSPARRPGGRNFACTIAPAVDRTGPELAVNGYARPGRGPNAWVAEPADAAPALTLAWDRPVTLGRVELGFDTDFDHPMESVLMGHPERAMPFCVKRYRLRDGAGRVVYESGENHQTRNSLRLGSPVTTDRLVVELLSTWGPVPAALFEVRVYPA